MAVYDEQVRALQQARDRGISAATQQVEVAAAKVRSEEHGLDAARAVAQQTRLNFTRQKDLFAEGLALPRQTQLAQRVERGALPAIDLADNERLIVDREVRFISSERAFAQAAINLSLFLRDEEGNPLTAGAERVPSQFPSDVKNAMAETALRAAYDQVEAARRNLELAQRLRGAEGRKLLLGTSSLLNVNIRELQAFDAAATLIATQADYFRALASFRAALGEFSPETALSMSAQREP